MKKENDILFGWKKNLNPFGMKKRFFLSSI